MPARQKRRKAAPALCPIQESEPQGNTEHAEPEAAQPVEQPACGTAAQELETRLREADEHVEEVATDMWRAAYEDMERLRQEFKLLCCKIPKKVREMSVASFFSLTQEEAQQPCLTNMEARLEAMAPAQPPQAAASTQPANTSLAATASEQGAPQPSAQQLARVSGSKRAAPADPVPEAPAAEAAPAAAAVTAAAVAGAPVVELPPMPPGTRVTRRTAARTGQQAQLVALPATTTTRRTRAATKQEAAVPVAPAPPPAPALEPQPPVPAAAAADDAAPATDTQPGAAAYATGASSAAPAVAADEAAASGPAEAAAAGHGTRRRARGVAAAAVKAIMQAAMTAASRPGSSTSGPPPSEGQSLPQGPPQAEQAGQQAAALAQTPGQACTGAAAEPASLPAAMPVASQPAARHPLQPVQVNAPPQGGGPSSPPAPPMAEAGAKQTQRGPQALSTPQHGAEQGSDQGVAGLPPPPGGLVTQLAPGLPAAAAATVGRVAVPAGAQVVGGFTLVRKAGVMGRTRATRAATAAGRGAPAAATAAPPPDAMVFTTTSGEQFLVDAEKGLQGVPEQHRADIQRQVEQLQRLATAALQRC